MHADASLMSRSLASTSADVHALHPLEGLTVRFVDENANAGPPKSIFEAAERGMVGYIVRQVGTRQAFECVHTQRAAA
jgi:hypothetical protein